MSTYTPGPWTVVGGHIEAPYFEHANCHKTIVFRRWRGDEMFCSNGLNTDANAHLMAAAPDMLEALKMVERHCPCGARPESPTTHPHVTGCLVGAAIQKAEGQS